MKDYMLGKHIIPFLVLLRTLFVILVIKKNKKKNPFNIFQASNSLDLLYINLWGPCFVTSMHGHRLFFIIIDDHTRYTCVFLMNNESKTRIIITNFITFIENRLQLNVKVIQIDNSNEFLMIQFFSSKGIIH